MFELFVIGSLLLVAVIAGLHWHQQQHRRAELQRIAEELGWQFDPVPAPSLFHLLKDLMPFRIGHAQAITNLVQGEIAQVTVMIFDFRYETGGGKNHRSHKQTMMCFRSRERRFPNLQLCPERFYHAWAEWLGYEDIDFPEHPEFSRRYRLIGEEPEEIRAFFTDEVLEYFEKHLGRNLFAQGRWLVFYREQLLVPTREWEQFLKQGLELFTLLHHRARLDVGDEQVTDDPAFSASSEQTDDDEKERG
ncbi:MAG: hypothetical protein KatS3mg114_1287 [Planctomycetaceae bacterium]|nr:MAG: hypothetical protein KatS3mg114_1287 [Planctomycetaceae bacterium]